MKASIDPAVGDRFGKMTVTGPGVSMNGRKFPVQCDCGSRPLMANVTQLARWAKNNNGCTKCENRSITHGHGNVRNPTYGSWYSMKQRCTNPKNNDYPRYGGRGIKVCSRWLESFANFLADMGERPEGMTLDRYPDMNGDYEPGNCRWATHQQQVENTRTVQRVTFNGVTYPSTAAFCRAYNLCQTTVCNLKKKGMTPEQIIGELNVSVSIP